MSAFSLPKSNQITIHSGYGNVLNPYNQFFNAGVAMSAGWESYWHWPNLFFAANVSHQRLTYRFNESSLLTATSINVLPVFHYLFHDYLHLFGGIGVNATYFGLNLVDSQVSQNAWKPGLFARFGNRFAFGRFWGIDLEANWQVNELSGARYQNWRVQLGSYVNFSIFNSWGKKDQSLSDLEIVHRKIDPLYSAHAEYYADNGGGWLKIKNRSKQTLQNIQLSTFTETGIIGIKKSPAISVLAPNEEVEIKVPLFLIERNYHFAEAKYHDLKIQINYEKKHQVLSYKDNHSLLIHPRNTINWEEINRIGSFVTPRDPMVLNFSRQILSQNQNLERSDVLAPLVRDALLLFEGLRSLRIAYIRDPQNQLFKSSHGQYSLDYVQFPSETLQKKGGDCDDLTVLFAALLESVNIETSIVVVPGHVFLMFNTETLPWNYLQLSADKKMMEEYDGSLWIPLEMTDLKHGFVYAWRKGVDNLRMYRKQGMTIHPIAKAWKKYKPAEVEISGKVDFAFVGPYRANQEIHSYLRSHYEARILLYQTRLGRSSQIDMSSTLNGNQKLSQKEYNELVALYSRLGELSKAEQFLLLAVKQSLARDQELKKTENASVQMKKSTKSEQKKQMYSLLLHQGNILALQGKLPEAIVQYGRAVELLPEEHAAYIAQSLVYYQMREYVQAAKNYHIALQKEPGYKLYYSFLDQKSDGLPSENNVSVRGKMLWLAMQ